MNKKLYKVLVKPVSVFLAVATCCLGTVAPVFGEESTDQKITDKATAVAEPVQDSKNKSDEDDAQAKSVAVVTLIAACYGGVKLCSAISNAISYHVYDSHKKDRLKSYFEGAKITPAQYTPKPAGERWGWAACLEGVLRISEHAELSGKKWKGINQKDIVKAVFPKINFLKRNRTECLPTCCLQGASVRSRITKLLSDREQGNKIFSHALLMIDDEINVSTVQKGINVYYQKINRKPFVINSGYSYDGTHFVSVTVNELNDNNITFEDPEAGQSVTIAMQAFCAKYFSPAGVADIPAIEMFTIVDSSVKIPSELVLGNAVAGVPGGLSAVSRS